MKYFAVDDEISVLEQVLAKPGSESAVEATVSLAWHLRQRDSARALRLVDSVISRLVPPSGGRRRPGAHRARCALAACEASALLCDFDVAERWLAEARQHVDLEHDPFVAGDAWLVEAVLAKMRVQRPREMAAHEEAIACFEKPQAADRRALAEVWLRFERGYEHADIDHSLTLQPPGDGFPETSIAWHALWNASRGMAMSYRSPSESAQLYRQAATQAREVGLVRLEIICLINAGAATQGLGDLDLAAECFDQAATRANASGWPTLIGAANTRVGELLRHLGALEESRSVLTDAIVALAIGAPGLHLAIAYGQLAETMSEMGKVDESLALMRRSIALFRGLGFVHSLALNLIFEARLLVASGLAQEALALCAETRALIVENDLLSLHVGVTDILAELHHRFELPAPAGMRLPTAALHYGEAILVEGRRVAGWEVPARVFTFLAERWATAGDHGKAYDYARQALKASERESQQRLNYPLALVRLRRRATLGDAQPADAARTLTPKERSILMLVARSYSHEEIAQSCDLSDETVKWHLKNLFNKLDAGFVAGAPLQEDVEVAEIARYAGAPWLVMRLSLDEEHTSLEVRDGPTRIDLGERGHHYCLVTLARRRLNDRERGIESGAQGWLARAELSRMLGMEVTHLNIQIFRAREQVRAALPATAALSRLIERRRGELRLGEVPFEIYRGDSLECRYRPN